MSGNITFMSDDSLTCYIAFYDTSYNLLGTYTFDSVAISDNSNTIPVINIPASPTDIYSIIIAISTTVPNYMLYQPMIISYLKQDYKYIIVLKSTVLPNTQQIQLDIIGNSQMNNYILAQNIDSFVVPMSSTDTCNYQVLGSSNGTQNKYATTYICVNNSALKNKYLDKGSQAQNNNSTIIIVIAIIIFIIIVIVIIVIIYFLIKKKKSKPNKNKNKNKNKSNTKPNSK